MQRCHPGASIQVVISTGAQRSGEISVLISTLESHGQRLSSRPERSIQWRVIPTLKPTPRATNGCHLDRSAAQWRDLCVDLNLAKAQSPKVVISTGAQRQWRDLSQWKRPRPPLSSRPERSAVENSVISTGAQHPQGVEQTSTPPLHHVPYSSTVVVVLCHLDRSAAQWS